jgi:hypothetical protein
MAAAVFALCAVTSIVVAVLLIRSRQRNKSALLLWSSLCFVGLALNNILLFVDRVIVPGVDLSLARQGTAFVALALMIFGLVWETR